MNSRNPSGGGAQPAVLPSLAISGDEPHKDPSDGRVDNATGCTVNAVL